MGMWPALLALALAPAAHAADPDNLFGGRVVTSRQGFVSVGYPTITGGLRFPVGTDLDLSVRVRTAYGVGIYAAVPNAVAFDLGLAVRWQLVDAGDLAGAFVAEVWAGAAVGSLPTAGGVGLLSPGWMMTYRAADVVDVDIGLLFQADLWVQQGIPYFVGAVPIVFGAEFRVVDGIVVGLRFEGGPSFVGGQPPRSAPGLPGAVGSGVGARMRAVVGLGVVF